MIYLQHALMQKQLVAMMTSVQAVFSRSSAFFSKLPEIGKLFWHHALA